jgi:uracil-DNA glycosylase
MQDLGLGDEAWPSDVGTLTPWLCQGVLLLNTILTVEDGKPASHEGFGWEELTRLLLGSLLCARSEEPLVFLGWGQKALTVLRKLKLGPKHLLLESAHPSPLSMKGFFGCKHFSKANAHLVAHGSEPIVWALAS